MKGHLKVSSRRSYIITILITLLVCPELYAAGETLPTPEEIIAKNIEAMGGKEALKKIKNRKIVAINKIPSMNMDIKDTIYQERPNKFYSATDRGTREGTNGKIAWGINPSIGAGLLEGDKLSNYLFMKKFDGIDGLDVPHKSMKTEGIEQINGKACYKVVKTPENGTERIVYYDKKSYMIVKITSYYKSPQGKNKIEQYFEEYQKINNILFPYKRVVFSNGQKVEEVTTKTIELNIEIPEGIFDIPEDIKAIMNNKTNTSEKNQGGNEKKFDGTWKGTVPGPDGNPLEVTYVFEAHGEALRGTVNTKLGGGPFMEGKIEGNKISFITRTDPSTIIETTGTLSGDVINMIQKKGDVVKKFILKRVTEGNDAG